MKAKKEDLVVKIAKLLPEGLNEEILGVIAEVVGEKIEEEVKSQIGNIIPKVTSFVRGKIEKLKEQALSELELENETFRNAQLFESIKSLFAVENSSEDEMNGMAALASISESQEQKIDVLVKEIDRLTKDNIKLRNTGKVLLDQNKQLKESVTSLKESTDTKTSIKGKSSDKAIVVTQDNFKINESKNQKAVGHPGNEFLGANVLDAFKQLKGK